MLDGFGTSFRARLRTLAASWPDPPRRSFDSYLKDPGRSKLLHPLRPSPDTDKPYWLLLPCWIADADRTPRRGIVRATHRAFVHDVLSAQYYLFLGIRLRDDVFDGQWCDSAGTEAADRLISEAGRMLALHFERHDPFWNEYRRCLRDTGRGIILADTLQRAARPRPTRLLGAYALTNAVFCVAPAAVCYRAGRRSTLGIARRFSDRFSAGAQILDDLADVREDLEAGRLNYAAAAGMAASGASRGYRPSMARVGRGLIEGRAGIAALEVAARHIEESFDALQPLRSGAVREYGRSWKRGLDQMRAGMFGATISALRGRRPARGNGRSGR